MPVYLLTAYAVGVSHAGDRNQVAAVSELVEATDYASGLNEADKRLRDEAGRKVQQAGLRIALDNAFSQEISYEKLAALLLGARPIREIALENEGLSSES